MSKDSDRIQKVCEIFAEVYREGVVEGVAAERERIRKVVEGLFDKHCNAKSKDFEFGYAGAFNLVLTFLKDGEG